MSDSRAAILGEIATEAGMERNSFLTDAADQLRRFLDTNGARIRELGGMVLIDDDPDYLSIAPDGTFRSRTRYQDEKTGQWLSETEVIDNASELVEIYNPADLFAAFAEAARAEAGLAAEPTAAQDLFEVAGVASEATVGTPVDPYAEAADDWAAAQVGTAPVDATDAARRLYDLALTFQERSQASEARLIEQFESAAQGYSRMLGDTMILDDEDERLWFKSGGSFEAEVLPEREEGDAAEGQWTSLRSPDDMVQFYDPTDLFGDLAETIADQFPEVAPDEDEEEDEEEGEQTSSRRSPRTRTKRRTRRKATRISPAEPHRSRATRPRLPPRPRAPRRSRLPATTATGRPPRADQRPRNPGRPRAHKPADRR
jgi:hypothetical protein